MRLSSPTVLLVVLVTFGRRREKVCRDIPKRATRLDPEICAVREGVVMSLRPEFFFFRIPPSLNMLRIQAGEQEKSEILFFLLGCNAMYQSTN